jgi:RNA polymerase sigma-70 factor, ECF subfamily
VFEQEMQITGLLLSWQSGDRMAFDRLMGIIYPQLYALATRSMRQERPNHTLSATALVHEAYLRLFSAKIEWQDRVHFLAVAATTMRRILVDYARELKSAKRGGQMKVSLDAAERVSASSASLDVEGLISLDDALQRLLKQDKRKAELMEMVYFGGLNCDEAAAVMKVSVATVNRDLKLAKAWLKYELRSIEPQYTE